MNLSEPFDENKFYRFLEVFLPDFLFDKRNVSAENEFFSKVIFLGSSEKIRTSVLVINSQIGLNSRISLTKESFKILKKFSIYRALIVYLNEDSKIWRMSLLTAQPKIINGKIVQEYSNPERFSYVLGSEVGVATARKYLLNLGTVESFEDLQYRFSIEAVNRDFYTDIGKHFYQLVGMYDADGTQLQENLLKLPGKQAHKFNQEFAIRLIGRIIFCWFLREKKSVSGQSLLPSRLFDEAIKNEVNLFSKFIEPLFFECLNKPLGERPERYANNGYELIPYLNGGLFNPNEGDGGDFYAKLGYKSNVQIPDSWFKSFFEMLSSYNFTLDENLDFDVELSIDPEMLGRIFENLLAEINPETGESARKTTGSFYTPRKIVSYMTDLCLTEYLLEETNISKGQINALMTIDNLDDIEHPLSDDEKKLIAEKLLSLKSLDPACGSGAFPIGLLQKIVFLLEQVDSDFRVVNSRFPKDFFKTKKHLSKNGNYLRKLVIIKEILYGVDIQPIAVEMSKLRCFLTLIVEQEIVDDLENRGIEPLPNLDFKFVCADTLIKLNSGEQLMFGENTELENVLQNLRSDYYTTTNLKTREDLKKKYLKLVSDEISFFESSRSTQLKTYNPFVPGNKANFFDSKTMFGVVDFHIVIGNPPYVKIEHLDEATIANLNSQYTEIRNNSKKNWADDLYVHFIFKAFDLIKENGFVCFITNDSFIGLESKTRIRELLLKKNLIELTTCPKETFGATIYTAIFLASNKKILNRTYKAQSFNYPDFEIVDKALVSKSYISNLPNKRLVLKEDVVVAKLLANEKVRDYLKVIDTGIDTGNVREKMFSFSPSPEFKSKLLQGRQIEKWAIWWDSPKAKYKYCNPDYVPQNEFGIGRGGKKSKLKEYWSYRRGGDVSYHFLAERILIRQTADTIFGAYQNNEEDGQFYTDNTLFTIVKKDNSISLKYFLGILNSKVMEYVYKYLSMEEGKILAQVKTDLVEQLPMVVDESKEQEVVKIVNELINSRRKNHGCDMSELENDLEKLVCDIFNLTEEERKIILAT